MLKKGGIICKMNKLLYGLNDASQKFWLKVREVSEETGMMRLQGDETFLL